MGYEPENTLASFRKAITLGVDMVELDVHVCKSGELVVVHDDKADRTTDGKGEIAKLSLVELKKLNAGNSQRIPELKEVLGLIKGKAGVNIELKGKGTAIPVAQAIKTYNAQGWNQDKFIVSSFDMDELARFRLSDKTTRVGILFEKKTENPFYFAKKFAAYSVNPPLDLVTSQLVSKAHGRNLKVFVWTVDNPEDIQKVKNLGVDGIFSNYPDRL